jgi:hypothetical protein
MPVGRSVDRAVSPLDCLLPFGSAHCAPDRLRPARECRSIRPSLECARCTLRGGRVSDSPIPIGVPLVKSYEM